MGIFTSFISLFRRNPGARLSSGEAENPQWIGATTIIFPNQRDRNGEPIKFERGVAYVVGPNGRWRKRRELKTKISEQPAIADQEHETFRAVEPKSTAVSTELKDTRATGDAPYFSTEMRLDLSMHRHWRVLMASCSDPSSRFFQRYGDNGAEVVDEWRDYKNFERDMAKLGGIGKRKSLVRPDPTKPFGPDNISIVQSHTTEAGMRSKDRKFTDIQIKHIRNSPQSVSGLATLYDVNSGTISQIKNRKTYRNVR